MQAGLQQGRLTPATRADQHLQPGSQPVCAGTAYGLCRIPTALRHMLHSRVADAGRRHTEGRPDTDSWAVQNWGLAGHTHLAYLMLMLRRMLLLLLPTAAALLACARAQRFAFSQALPAGCAAMRVKPVCCRAAGLAVRTCLHCLAACAVRASWVGWSRVTEQAPDA